MHSLCFWLKFNSKGANVGWKLKIIDALLLASVFVNIVSGSAVCSAEWFDSNQVLNNGHSVSIFANLQWLLRIHITAVNQNNFHIVCCNLLSLMLLNNRGYIPVSSDQHRFDFVKIVEILALRDDLENFCFSFGVFFLLFSPLSAKVVGDCLVIPVSVL